MLQYLNLNLPRIIRQPIFKLLQRIEHLIPFLLGKGYGTATLNQEIDLALELLGKHPKLAIDVGGNIGDYTATLLRRAPKCEIHVFEPAGLNQKILKNRFQHIAHVHLVATGLAATKGKATLFADAAGSGMASLSKRDALATGIDFTHAEPITLQTFEEYWSTILQKQPIDLVKIDIEGHELAALHGFGESLAHVRVIQFEFGGTHIDTRTFWLDFLKFFTAHNFALYRITPLGLLPVTKYRAHDEHLIIANYLALRQE